MSWYVYMLRCGDGTIYTGSSNNIAWRLAAHSSGKGAKYTRGRLPVVLIYSEELSSHSQALRREAAIKKLSRKAKLALAAERGCH